MLKTDKKCPKCKSRDIWVNEMWKDHSITWMCVDGNFISDGNMEPGNPYKVEGGCSKCLHKWTFRGARQIYDIMNQNNL